MVWSERFSQSVGRCYWEFFWVLLMVLFYNLAALRGGVVFPNHDTAPPPPLPMHLSSRCRVRLGSQHLCHVCLWQCPRLSDEIYVTRSRRTSSLVAPAERTWTDVCWSRHGRGNHDVPGHGF